MTLRAASSAVVLFSLVAFAEEPASLQGHKKDVNSVSISADGKLIASGSDDNHVFVWDGAAKVADRESDQGAVKAVAFSPDAKLVAVGSQYGDVSLWDREANKDKFTKRGHSSKVSQIVFLADGKRFVTASGDHTVKVWDLSGAEKAKLEGHKYDINGVAVSADGSKAWSCDSNGGVISWNLAKGKQAAAFQAGKSAARAITLSPDGKTLVVGLEDGSVVFLDPAKGKELAKGKVSDPVNSLAFSPDAKTLAVATQAGDLFLVDGASGAAGKTLKGHERPVMSVAFTKDGKRLVSGSMDMTVRIWPME